MTKKTKRICALAILCVLPLSMIGCQKLRFIFGQAEEKFKGREATIQTYDEDGNVIDRVHGKSISISTEDKFDKKNAEGQTISKSSVLSLTVGGNSMTHVGSSLIVFEDGLKDLKEEYDTTVDVQNNQHSLPFINRIYNNIKNSITGDSKIVLIRSQSGKPLATFVGKSVSYFPTSIDKTTGIVIDGKYLFIYKCDYTIIDTDMLN